MPGISECFGHESENNCKPVAALFCVTTQAAPAPCAAPAHLLALLHLLMSPFLRLQSKSEILLSPSLGRGVELAVFQECILIRPPSPVLESNLTGAEGSF